MDLQYINRLIADGELVEALSLLESEIADNPDNADALYARGRVYWALDRRGEAMSDYASAAQFDPSSPAAAALEHTQAIFDFFNPDIYNP